MLASNQPTTLPRPGVIVFDMDGTLVDVSRSYRETLPAAAACYLRLLGLTPPPETVAHGARAYDQFKLMGGFNDDWNVTAGYLELLLAGLPPAPPLAQENVPTQDDLLAALLAAAAPLAGLPVPLPDVAAAVEPVRRLGGGLPALRRVTGGRNAHLVWHKGEADRTDLVQRVFEEIYLGSALFAAAYAMPARFHRGPGLIEHEALLIGRATLEALSRFARLGIATGRARFELEPTLARMDLARYFPETGTMTEALAVQAPGGESLLKPHPYLLTRVADALDPGGRLAAAYVGDTRDDVVAAQRANGARRWQAIALTTADDKARLREQFTALGADAVLAHPDELASLWRL